MRPTRLEVKGFTAFREKCVIDFSGFDLFAITGPTGAGKTSLLDAMTYALYGRTSRLNKAGGDLISQGAQAMSVLLEFRVGDRHYRVLRSIKGNHAAARFEERQNGAWSPVAGAIGEVNDRILRVVGLDFGAFTKTVILPQGKFDTFLRGEPKERREVLSGLLEMDVYQRMMKSANEKSRDAAIRADERAANIDADASPEALSELEHRLEELCLQQAEVATRCALLDRVYPHAAALREKRNSLAASRRDLEQIAVQADEARKHASSAARHAETHRAALRHLQQEIDSTPYDPDQHLRLNAWLPQARQLRKLEDQLTAARKEAAKLSREVAAAGKSVHAARAMADAARLRAEEAARARAGAESAYKTLRVRHGSADALQQLIKDLEDARKDAAGAPQLEHQVSELELRAQALDGEIAAASTASDRAAGDFADAENFYEQLHALDRAAALRHELKPGEPCPVCEQLVDHVPPVPDSGLLSKAQKRVAQSKTALDKAHDRLLALRVEAQALPAKIEVSQAQLDARRHRLEQVTSRAHLVLGSPVEDPVPPLRALVKETKAAEQEVQDTRDASDEASRQQNDTDKLLRMAENQQQLSAAAETNVKSQIDRWTAEVPAFEEGLRDAPPVDEIAARIRDLEIAKKRRADLEVERKTCEAAIQQAEKGILESTQQSAALAAERRRSEERIRSLEAEISLARDTLRHALPGFALQDDRDEAAQIHALLESTRTVLGTLQTEAQKGRFAVDDLARRIQRNHHLQDQVVDLRAQSALYRDLGTWLNAGNFQQYLLGSAFETLAREGSRHLKELSGGRYEFAFEGDEFVVNDHFHAGESRSARTLSGGESFLASLALALALADSITQFDAERGAVNLESLFLDEGFSTLDSETLSKVSDAIQVLQNGRRLVGIVTHVQSLADQLPVRIDIEKTASGSRIAPSTSAAASIKR